MAATSNLDLHKRQRLMELLAWLGRRDDILRFRVFLFRAIRALLLWAFARKNQLIGCGRELGSFAHRISLQFGKRYHQPIFRLGPVLHQGLNGHLEVCTRTRDCICDIESFSALHPWATSVDFQNYYLGWEAGARWVSHNHCRSCTRLCKG